MDISTPQPSIPADAQGRDEVAARIVPALLAACLGLLLLYAAGFSPIEVLHSAAHDSRHSASFPCH